jgi:hypothetical protein
MRYPGAKKFRWAFFAVAVLGIAQTPSAISSAYSAASKTHWLILAFLEAFAIRFLTIWMFLYLWWDTRSTQNTKSIQSENDASH